MTFVTRDLDESQYNARRFAFIKQFEERGQVSLQGYIVPRVFRRLD